MDSLWQKWKPRALPLLIILFGLWVRCWDLGDNPPGFFRDEADKAVTARSLLTSGQDLAGRTLPVFVRSLNVYTSGIYQYLLLPFILVLGMGEWVIRLPAALAGSATVGVTYLLGKRAYGRTTGLIAASLLAISPWHVAFSRWANQGILLPLCISLSVYFLLQGRGATFSTSERVSPGGTARFRPFFFSALFLSLGLYSYAPAKVFVPLFLVAMAAVYWQEFFPVSPGQRWPSFYKFLGIFLLLGIPMMYYTLFETEQSSLRFERISIFSEAQSFRELVFLFLQNYLSHFSLSFLITAGDNNLRHSVPHVGQLLRPEGVALLLGLYALLRRHSREDLLLLCWVLLGPLPAALTREGVPHALRSIAILPALQIVAAAGIMRFIEYFSSREEAGVFRTTFPRRVAIIAWVAAFVFFGATFLISLFFYYPVQAAPWWEYGYKQAVGYVEEHPRGYEEVVVSGMTEYPEIQVLYHARLDPADYRRTHRVPGYRFIPFGQSYRDDYSSSRLRSLYLLTRYDPVFHKPLVHVKYPDGSLAWVVIEHPSASK